MDAPDQQAATAPPRGTHTTWVIDPVHSLVEFAVRHLMVTTFKGCFTGVTGTIVLDEVDLSHSRVEVSIDAASVDTRNEQRDAHLRSDDFFEVATYPQIIFESWGVEPEDGERAKVSGDLTIHGVTRLAVLDVKINGRSTTPGRRGDRLLREHHDQPQRLRADLERRAGCRRRRIQRRGHDPARDRDGQAGLTRRRAESTPRRWPTAAT